jgi:hypothetical protein
MTTALPMTARGLLELRVSEHLEEVEVKEQALFTSAKGVVHRTGIFQIAEAEVTIDVNRV